jgi:hypothetical protein
MDRSDHEWLEATFAALFAELGDTLASAERAEIIEFVDVGEYGVALETLVALVVEEQKQLPAPAFATICLLADRMAIRDRVVPKALACLRPVA